MFLYTLVNIGSEKLLKEEMSIKYPNFHFAYSKPGFITFKNCDDFFDFNEETKLDLVFARIYGLSIGKCNSDELVPKIAEYGSKRKVQRYNLELEIISTEPAAIGDEILDIIEMGEDEYWLGIRKVAAFEWKSAAGIPRLIADEFIPSRAYFKIEEAMALTQDKVKEGDVVLEIGSAPGGATYSMLKRGAKVYGVDNAEMSEICMKNNKFIHMKMAMQKLTKDNIPENITTVVCDVNLDPYDVIPFLMEIFVLRPNIKRVYYTLKMGKRVKVKDIPDFILRFERAGFTKIKAVQLPSNKSEIMVYGGK